MALERTNHTEREYPHRELDDAPFLAVTRSVCCAALSLRSSCQYYSTGQADRIDYRSAPLGPASDRYSTVPIPESCLHDSSNSRPVPIAQLSNCRRSVNPVHFSSRWSSANLQDRRTTRNSRRDRQASFPIRRIVLVPLAPERLDSAGFPGLALETAAGHFADRYFQDCFDHASPERFPRRCNSDRRNCSRRSFPFGRARFLGCALSFEAATRPDPPALLSAPSSWHVLSVPSPAPSPYRTQDLCWVANSHTSAQAAWLLSETSHHSSGVRRRLHPSNPHPR